MINKKTALWIGILIFLQVTTVATGAEDTRDVMLYYTGNTWGVLEPCQT